MFDAKDNSGGKVINYFQLNKSEKRPPANIKRIQKGNEAFSRVTKKKNKREIVITKKKIYSYGRWEREFFEVKLGIDR